LSNEQNFDNQLLPVHNDESEISKNTLNNLNLHDEKSNLDLIKSNASLKSEMRETKNKFVNEKDKDVSKVGSETNLHEGENFSHDLMREILTLNDEDIVRIIGKKFATDKRVSAYRKFITEKVNEHLNKLESDFEQTKQT